MPAEPAIILPTPAAPYDPRQDIYDSIAAKGIVMPVPMLNFILVCQYIPPDFKVLPGGQRIHIPAQTQQNAEYDGLVGLVLAKGPDCFAYDDPAEDERFNVRVGDWCLFGYYETQASRFKMRSIGTGKTFGMIKDRDIRGKIADPTEIMPSGQL